MMQRSFNTFHLSRKSVEASEMGQQSKESNSYDDPHGRKHPVGGKISLVTLHKDIINVISC